MSEEEIEPQPVKVLQSQRIWYDDDISDTSSVYLNDDEDILESLVESMSSTGTISLVSSSPTPCSVAGPPSISTGKMGNPVQLTNIHFPAKRFGTGRL